MGRRVIQFCEGVKEILLFIAQRFFLISLNDVMANEFLNMKKMTQKGSP